MRLQKIKLLTGATLSVLMSAVSVHPVMANPPTQIAQTQTTNTANTQTLIGFVKDIVGDVVTISPENSRYRTLRIQKCVLKIIGLVPGMKVRVLLAGDMVQNIAVIPDYKVVATTVVRPATIAPRPAPEPQPMLPPPAPRVIPRPAPAPMPAPRPIPAPRPAPVRGLW
ncbi:autotransporter [Tychonema sp. LEGE 07199]|uniref:autotransporter n=1 Tax=unclassified Tychonema TaxID=2642144 RepID=UPI00187DE50D|nr:MULTISPECIES: autotransporter [unclassified Tychonema]MBE9123537.1 autotransporter [Tychonema sp. LEGE 07199]MBE9135034.1 autotransporter [Tychonema sp. LEGE 07196]